MKHLLMTWVCLIGSLPLLYSQTAVEHRVYFETAEHSLDEEARTALDNIYAQYQAGEIRGIIVRGHTDAVGDDEANLELSQRRAITVARYLRSKGMNPKAVKLKAHSENQPIASNGTYAGRQQNRRVELTVFLREDLSDEDFGEDDLADGDLNGMPNSGMDDFAFRPVHLQANAGFYDCEKGLALAGRRGASLSIPQNAFENCGQPVKIVLEEFHRIEELAHHNVSTMDGDTLLESGGMVCISAFLDDKQLADIRAGVLLEIRIPSRKFDPEMSLYYADLSRKPQEVDWARMSGQKPRYEDSTKSYVFTISELGCINIDKPAPKDSLHLPLAVRLKKRMVKRDPKIYCNYRDRATMSQGILKGDQYITFGGAEVGETVRLKGSVRERRFTLRIDKKLQVDGEKTKIVEINGEEYRLIANVNGRGIGRKDRFRRGGLRLGFGEMSMR